MQPVLRLLSGFPRGLRPLLPPGVTALLALLCTSASGNPPVPGPADPPAVLSPALTRSLAAPSPEGGTLAVWVFFRETGRGPVERERALVGAEARLPARTLERRRTRGLLGRRGVDERDLPLDPVCLAAAEGTGARPRVRSRWLRAASYDATPVQVRALATLGCVSRIDLVGRTRPIAAPSAPARDLVDAPAAPAAPWSLDYGAGLVTQELINVPPVHELGYTGAGVWIAMLDTGFRMTHEAMDHVPVLAAHDFTGNDDNVDFEPGDEENTHVHGTHAAAMVMAYAPGHLIGPAYGVSALLARATSGDPASNGDLWVAAVEWAEAQGADIVSSSLGFWNLDDPLTVDGDTHPATIAADLAVQHGLVVVNGSGNTGDAATDRVAAPADGDSVIAVGAVDSTGIVTSWSSSGPTTDGRIKPDVCAQGEHVAVPDANTLDGYTSNGGTSFSGPQVAAVAALILERAPFLSPMQVREALRQTADHREAPDNDYGWGVVDALAAVLYWGPHIDHEPLPDTEDTVGPYEVLAEVTDPFPLGSPGPLLFHRVDGNAWQQQVLSPSSGSGFQASLPGVPSGSVVEYYLQVTDTQGLSVFHPLAGPGEPFVFRVAVDTEAPVVEHKPLRDQPLGHWPPAVVARVTDNGSVGVVELVYTRNGGGEEGPFPLPAGEDDTYVAPFPAAAAGLAPGDVIAYSIRARDTAQSPNQRTLEPTVFTVHEGIGNLLLVDDTGTGGATAAEGWLTGAGYSVTVRDGASLATSDFPGQDVLVLLSGANDSPLDASTLRARLLDWVGGGGPLLVEGGETAYTVHVFPGYPTIARDVLHSQGYQGDFGGPLVADAMPHPLLTAPLEVDPPVNLTGSTESELDRITPAPGADIVLHPTLEPSQAAALVYDAPIPDPRGSVVYYAFSLAALDDPVQAEALLVNGVGHLLATSLPTPVRLLSFTARREGSGARLEWLAVEAVDHAGFHVHREEADGRRIRLTPELLSGGAAYAFLDPEAPPGETSYWLASWSRAGDVAWHGPAVLDAGGFLAVPPRAVPNPAREEAMIRYTLSRGGRVRVGIFDVRGRLVREQPSLTQAPGGQSWTWDRRDASGSRVPPGVYFYVLHGPDGESSGKITLLP